MVGCADFSEDIQRVDENLREDVSDLQATISALQVKLAEDYATKQSVESLKNELNGTIAGEVADLEKAIASAVATLNEAINAKADEADLVAVEKTVEALQAELTAAKNALQKSLDDAKKELKAADEANANAIKDLEARITAAEKSIEGINAAVVTLQSDVESLKNAYMQNTEALTNLKNAYDKFVEETETNFANVKASVAALDAYVKDMEVVLHERINDVAETLTDAITLFTDEIDLLKAEDEYLGKSIEGLQVSISNVNNLLNDEAAAREDADEELWTAIYAAQTEIGSVHTQLVETQEELGVEIALARAELGQAITSVLNQHLDLVGEVADIAARLSAQEAALAAYKEVVDEAIAVLQTESANHTLAITNLQGMADKAAADIEDINAELNAINTKIEDLQKAHAELIAGIQNMKGAIDAQFTTVDEAIDAIQAELSKFTQGIQNMKGELDATIAALEERLDKFNETITEMIALQERILSLAYVPEVLLNNRGVIDFVSMYVRDETTQELVYLNSAPTVATYLINPSKANLQGVEWAIATRGIKTRATEAPSISIVNVSEGQGAAKGRVQFELTADGTLPARCNYNQLRREDQVLATLVATTPAGDVIYSDEAFAQQTSIESYAIINKKSWNADNNEDGKVERNLEMFPTWKEDVAFGWYNIEMVYNKPINIYDYLETFAFEIDDVLPSINVNPTYKVTLLEEYISPVDKTNQQKFVTLAEDGTVSVNSEFLVGGIPAIGRTPIFYVESQVADVDGKLVTVASAYVIVKIVAAPAEELEPVVVTLNGEFDYNNLLYPGEKYPTEMKSEEGLIALTWEAANQQILDKLNMTATEFAHTYRAAEFYSLNAEGEKVYPENGIDIHLEDWWAAAYETATNPAWLIINNQIKENTSGKVYFVYQADGRPNVVLEFNYSVKHDHVWPAFNPDYTLAETVDGMTVVQVKGKMNGESWVMQSEIKEHFKDYLKGYKLPGNHYDFVFTLAPEMPVVPQTIAEITEGDWTTQEIRLTSPLYGASKDFVVGMEMTLANGNKCYDEYVVRFVNPFVVTLKDVTLKTYVATPDTEDLMNYLIVKDLDNNVIYDGTKATGKFNANNPYLLTLEDIVPTFTCTPDSSFGGKLTLSGSEIRWYNGGTDLQHDKTTAYGVSVAISNISVPNAEASVKVLSTANSK